MDWVFQGGEYVANYMRNYDKKRQVRPKRAISFEHKQKKDYFKKVADRKYPPLWVEDQLNRPKPAPFNGNWTGKWKDYQYADTKRRLEDNKPRFPPDNNPKRQKVQRMFWSQNNTAPATGAMTLFECDTACKISGVRWRFYYTTNDVTQDTWGTWVICRVHPNVSDSDAWYSIQTLANNVSPYAQADDVFGCDSFYISKLTVEGKICEGHCKTSRKLKSGERIMLLLANTTSYFSGTCTFFLEK